MKTPMQEAIEKVQSLRQIDAVINPIGVIESILSNMLEKEKEVIMDAYDAGFFDGSNIPYTSDDVDDNYFNKTFNTKER